MCRQLLLMLWLVCAPFHLPALQDTYLRFLSMASSFYQEEMSGLQRRLEFTLPELLDPTRKHSSQVQLLGLHSRRPPVGLSKLAFIERWLHCRGGLECFSTCVLCYLGPGESGYRCLVC